jgi:hypothetical protein
MDKWRHIFIDDGEYAPPEKILGGLTLEQVTRMVSKESHSIYDELWHVVRWQNIVVFSDEKLYEAWRDGEVYPTQQPTAEREWQDLVGKFFEGLEKVLEWTSSPEKLATKSDSGNTMSDNLVSLAVHNAYHFGKIVTLRQMMGSWPTR